MSSESSSALRAWNLSDDKRALLNDLARAIRNVAPLARSGSDLIALGEAWDAIEVILEGETVEVNVGLTVGFRRGDQNFEEGLFACFRINDEEIVLEELNTRYEPGIGSDHSTTKYAILNPEGRFDADGACRWLKQLNEIRNIAEAQLTTTRDHV